EYTDHLYVVNRRHQLIGWVALQDLVTRDPATPINQLIDDELESPHVDTPAQEVARQFSDNDWVSAPVVDDGNVLLRRITIDDVVDIIREQAEHQALGAPGLDENEDLFSPIRRTVSGRAEWLWINVLTALMASRVICPREATI